MLRPYSHPLSLVFPPPNEAELEDELDLGTLCSLLVRSGVWPEAVPAEILGASGPISKLRLVSLLHAVADRDSAVRDMLTLGHLAKILARVGFCDPSRDLALLAAPNRAFDDLSQAERSAFFRGGSVLPAALTEQEAARARTILEREARLQNEAARKRRSQ